MMKVALTGTALMSALQGARRTAKVQISKAEIGHGLLAATLFSLALAQPMAARAGECEEPGKGFFEQGTLVGQLGGVRTELCKKGFEFGATYTGEVFDNPVGGIHKGVKGQGRTELDFDFDLDKMVGSTGTTLHAAAMWIHGGRFSGKNVGSLMSVSNIEAVPTIRLHTLWGQQELFGEAVNIRLGQIAVDDEFALSKLSSVFMNGTFGVPFIVSGALPNGGPAYPMPAPGARLKLTFDDFTWMGAAFGGDPAGEVGLTDPQRRNHYGTSFSFSRGTLYITEGAFALNQDKESKGPAGTYKVGAWYHSGRFNDQHFDNRGQSLADPNSTGTGRPGRGNGGLYAGVDQMLMRGEKPDDGLGVFLRGGWAPSDRNQVGYYVDGGVTYKGLVPGRDDDTLALGVAYAPISGSLTGLDKDTRRFNNQPNRPVRDSETVIELTYQAQITPWWTIQPDIQYIIHPGGDIPNPTNTGGNLKAISDALALGLRTALKF